MNINKSLSLVVCLCLLLLGSLAAVAQTPVSIKIYASDNPGVTLDSVIIGVSPAATNGIDTALGEKELPPAPPAGGFDFRCVTRTGSDVLGLGSQKNIHHLVRDSQGDFFKLQFQGSDGGSNVVIRWPAGLGSVGGGYWKLTDGAGGVIFADVDMTTQTQFTYPDVSLDPATVLIVKGDAQSYHTATSHDLAIAADSKGKVGKAEKRKNYAAEATFTFTYGGSGTATGLHVEYSEGILQHFSVNPFTAPAPDPLGKIKKFDYTGASMTNGQLAVIHLEAKGTKALAVSKYYFIDGTVKPVAIKGPVPTTEPRQWLLMPNWNNVGLELYAAAYPKGSLGLELGLTAQQGVDAKGKPIFKYVYHPKWADVLKTLVKKGVEQTVGATACLDVDLKGKPIVKALKTLPPDKAKPNELLAALLAFKFNIAMSSYGHTSTGFGQLYYIAQSGDPADVNDNTLDMLALRADSALSCNAAATLNLVDALRILKSINAAFSGPFDTSAFGGGVTIVKPFKSLAQVSTMLYRPSLTEYAVAGDPNFVYKDPEPSKYSLEQNYPNPFNPTTTIEFNLREDAVVSLKVYNILGQEVATLADREEFTEGNNTVEFNAASLASGVYYYRLIVNDGQFQQVKKMMLLK